MTKSHLSHLQSESELKPKSESGSDLEHKLEKKDSRPASVQEQVDLTAYTTFKLPTQARYFAHFHNETELLDLLAWAHDQHLCVHVLGGGSNVLMPPYLDALVIQSAMNAVRLDEVRSANSEYRYVWVDAALNWHSWVERSLTLGFGLENLALIPGTVGACPIQNIGAYGVEVSELIECVEGYDCSSTTPKQQHLSNAQCEFGYRDSVFKRRLGGRFIVTRVLFKLARTFTPNLSYAPLAQACSQASPSAEAVMSAVVALRSSKLPDPARIHNVGSFFKNPIVDDDIAERLRKQYPDMPAFPLADGRCKLAAGWLIEQCGWRGRRLNKVGMYEHQALVMVADSGATLTQVLELQQHITHDVSARFGVQLEREPEPFVNVTLA